MKRATKKATTLRIIALLAVLALTVTFFDFYAYAIDESASCISEYLRETMGKYQSDEPIEGVFIVLKERDEDYQLAETSEGETVYELDEYLQRLDSTSSYEEVKAVVMKKRKAITEYYYKRNEEFVTDLKIEKQTEYISNLNVILGNYTTEEVIMISKDERVKLISRDDPAAVLVSCVNDEDVHIRTSNIRSAGFTGSGIKIGVIEQARNITATTGTTYVTSVQVAGEPASDLIGEGGDEHAKRVVGIIRKIAPESHIYLTRSTTPTQVMDSAYTLAYTYEVDVLNISQGQYTESDWSSTAAYLNGLVRNLNLTICCAAGNPNTLSKISVLSSGENVIGVGAVKWVGGSDPYTQMSSTYPYSEYGGYSYTVNKPDFCASGDGICIPSYGLTTPKSGTSFSCPLITGTVALLMQKNSSLIGKQSLVKTLLAAGAKYKGNDSNYQNANNMCFSAFEGVGVVDSYCSYSVLNQTRYLTKTVSQSEQGNTYAKTISVSSSDNVIRVALSWLKRDNLSNFDLYVYKDNTLVASNLNSNTYTVYENLRAVEFSPAQYGYGTYTIKVVYQDLNNSSDSFSLSWY